MVCPAQRGPCVDRVRRGGRGQWVQRGQQVPRVQPVGHVGRLLMICSYYLTLSSSSGGELGAFVEAHVTDAVTVTDAKRSDEI